MNETTTEKEFTVINEISKYSDVYSNQRIIAQKAGISLGLTNLIIKQLISKGYIKALQLNKRKIQYMLTPKGFSEKINKSYNFALKTINYYNSLKKKIYELIEVEYKKGKREFIIIGDDDLSEIIEIVMKSIHYGDIKYMKCRSIQEITAKNTVILSLKRSGLKLKKRKTNKIINVYEYLAESRFKY